MIVFSKIGWVIIYGMLKMLYKDRYFLLGHSYRALHFFQPIRKERGVKKCLHWSDKAKHIEVYLKSVKMYFPNFPIELKDKVERGQLGIWLLWFFSLSCIYHVSNTPKLLLDNNGDISIHNAYDFWWQALNPGFIHSLVFHVSFPLKALMP